MMRLTSITALLLSVIATQFLGCLHHDKGYVEDTDPEMAAAIAQAQATLPQFWQAYDHPSVGEGKFTLVFRITDHGRIEHFSATNFERRDGKTFATIPKVPAIVSNVKPGDRIEIPPADITDWSYLRNEKYVGMFTMKPRFKYMSPDHVQLFKQTMADP